MLDVRLFRASLLPLLAAVVVVAFTPRPLPQGLASALPADLFNGGRAAAACTRLAATFPHRAPGSRGDDALARDVAGQLRADGLAVRTLSGRAATASGERRIESVIATNGSASRAPLVVVADRDAPGPSAKASLSATATLLELARDLPSAAGGRPLTLVSTSGGIAGARLVAAALPRPVAATIVIGDLAGARLQPPLVVPWSPRGGAASLELQQTVRGALAAQLSGAGAAPSVAQQLARFALPLTVSEQAPFAAAGIDAVLVQQGGELGPSGGQLSGRRLGAVGRALLAAIDALDRAPAGAIGAGTRDLTLTGNVLGGWVARLLVGLLILAAALCVADLVVRARHRKLALRGPLAWVLFWALPFLGAILYAKLLGRSGALAPLPAGPVTPAELPLRGGELVAALSVPVVCALACLACARLRAGRRIEPAAAPVALLCLGVVLAALLWLVDPYTAALAALALIVWLPALCAGEGYRSPAAALLWLAVSLAPLGLALALEASALGLGPIGFAWTWLLLLAGGGIGLGATLAIALAAALVTAAALVLARPLAAGAPPDIPITIRGPATYAGPGALGGTPSGRPSGRDT